MIPHTQSHSLQTGGAVGEQKEYSFEMNAHMASLLSDKLYSNKVEAIIRELACNAQDSHVEAGNPAPIDVHLPTPIEPYYYCEDYGIGLNHQGVLSVFTTYGSSTKRFSNLVTGTFGLGSKVFFAYTDQATITATKDGVRQVYTAYKDESGMPCITTMGAAIHDNSLPDGVKVYVGVLPGDIDAFTESAQSIFRRFDPRPNILGGADYEIQDYEEVVSGKGWLLRKEEASSYYSRRNHTHLPYAIQGNVAYRISKEEMQSHVDGTSAEHMIDLPLDVVFDIGDLDVASSREELSYNKQTIAAIITRFEEIYQELNTTIVPQFFAACTTRWEATQTLATLKEGSDNDHYKKLITAAALFDGEQVEGTITVKLQKRNPAYYDNNTSGNQSPYIIPYPDVKVVRLVEHDFALASASFAKKDSNPDEIILEGNSEYLILWDDKTQNRQPSRLMKYMNKEYGEAVKTQRGYWGRHRSGASNYPRHVYVLQCDTKAQFLAVIDALGKPPYKVFNDVVPAAEKTVRQKGVAGPKKDVVVTRFSGHSASSWGNSREQLRSQWSDTVLDNGIPAQGYYVNLKAWKIEHPDHYITIEQLFGLAKNIGIVSHHSEVYGVPGSVKNPFKDKKGWANLIDVVERQTTTWFDDPVNCAAVATHDAFNLGDVTYEDRREVEFITQLLTSVENHGTLPLGSVAKEYSDLFKKIQLNHNEIKAYVAVQSNLLRSSTIESKLDKEDKNKKSLIENILKHRTKFYSKYPMIKLAGTDLDDDLVPLVCDYIQLMES